MLTLERTKTLDSEITRAKEDRARRARETEAREQLAREEAAERRRKLSSVAVESLRYKMASALGPDNLTTLGATISMPTGSAIAKATFTHHATVFAIYVQGYHLVLCREAPRASAGQMVPEEGSWDALLFLIDEMTFRSHLQPTAQEAVEESPI